MEKGREAEGECLRLRAQLEAMEDERDLDRTKIQELVAEVSKLQLDHKQSLDESASLGVELEKAKHSLSPRKYQREGCVLCSQWGNSVSPAQCMRRQIRCAFVQFRTI